MFLVDVELQIGYNQPMNHYCEQNAMKLNFAFILLLVSLTGCTVYLPPSEAPIPAADPIIVPGKATTVKADNKDLTEIDPTKSKAVKTTVVEKGTTSKVNRESTRDKEPSRQGQVFYVVRPKDTVFEVMRKTGVHWKEIIQLNNLKAPKYTIFPGQNLRIK